MIQRPFRATQAALAGLLGLAAASSVQAQVLAFAQSGDGARIVLHDRAGPCVGEARLAEHIALDGRRIQGCWLMTSEKVLVSFFDGERGDIPLAHLKRLSEI
jgi:hypothetical protein